MGTTVVITMISLAIYHIALKQYANYIVSKMDLINSQTLGCIISNTTPTKSQYLISVAKAQSLIIDKIQILSIWKIITHLSTIKEKDKESATAFSKELTDNLPGEIKKSHQKFNSLISLYIRINLLYNILPLLFMFLLILAAKMISKIISLPINLINRIDFKNLRDINSEISLIFAPNTQSKIIKEFC